MNEIKKQHDSFLKEHSKRMGELRKPLHKAATSHSKALERKKPRMLTPKESAEKTKNWPKAEGHSISQEAQMLRDKENIDYQSKYKRAWND